MLGRKTLTRLTLSSLCAIATAGVLPATAFAHPDHSLGQRSQSSGATPPATQITTSIILNVTHPNALQRFVLSTVTPGDPNYHQFLSVDQFRDRFAPSRRQIRQFVHYLRSYGITVNKIYRDHLDLTVTGTAAALSAAMSTSLHDYTRGNEHFHRPDGNVALPGNFGQMVLAVPGLSNEPARFRPMIARLGRGAYAKITPPPVQWPHNGTATGLPGNFTVGDVANFYDINPLYHEGITGRGETVGIMTLANFNRADAYAYWKDIGLQVRPHRIRKIMVDGGTPVAANVGDDETSLDVEQSGGIAPDANIRVYIASNTNQGFLDLFYSAVSDNIADSVSISWGEPEELYFAALNNGVDATGQLQSMNQALLEGAAQGQSFFAASGDSGAYDINNSQVAPVPYFSEQLTVDAPASDPFITAAGGTIINTVIPGIPSMGCPAIPIPTQEVWGWDYLLKYWSGCLSIPTTQDPDGVLDFDDAFPVGGGGGVSSYWPLPAYQSNTFGIQRTQPGQSLYQYPNPPSTAGGVDLIDLPANFLGRNLPDLALNADPDTGYVLIDCTDYPASTNPQCAASGYGGTSFVAPQLNGITALIDQASGGRAGLLNPTLYALQNELGYGRGSPFIDIRAGNNWFYHGLPGYDDGSGLGSIDVARLALIYMFMNGGDQGEGNGGSGHHHR